MKLANLGADSSDCAMVHVSWMSVKDEYMWNNRGTSEEVQCESNASRICSVTRFGFEGDMDISVRNRTEMMGQILPHRSRAGLFQRSLKQMLAISIK